MSLFCNIYFYLNFGCPEKFQTKNFYADEVTHTVRRYLYDIWMPACFFEYIYIEAKKYGERHNFLFEKRRPNKLSLLSTRCSNIQLSWTICIVYLQVPPPAPDMHPLGWFWKGEVFLKERNRSRKERETFFILMISSIHTRRRPLRWYSSIALSYSYSFFLSSMCFFRLYICSRRNKQ